MPQGVSWGGASGSEASPPQGGRMTLLPRKWPLLHSEGAGHLPARPGLARGSVPVGEQGKGGGEDTVISSVTSTFLSLHDLTDQMGQGPSLSLRAINKKRHIKRPNTGAGAEGPLRRWLLLRPGSRPRSDSGGRWQCQLPTPGETSGVREVPSKPQTRQNKTRG